MEPTGLTIEILRDIRDEIRGTNARIDATNARLDGTNARLDATNDHLDALGGRVDVLGGKVDVTNGRIERLERRQTDMEIRLSTEIVAVVGAVNEVRDLLREDRHLRARVDDHERRLAAVETRVG